MAYESVTREVKKMVNKDLPMIARFNSMNNSNQVFLSFHAIDAKNNSKVVIERSTDGENFEHFHTYELNQKNVGEYKFSCTDQDPNFGLSYYRLQVKTSDEVVADSKTLMVAVDAAKKIPTAIVPMMAEQKAKKTSTTKKAARNVSLEDDGQAMLMESDFKNMSQLIQEVDQVEEFNYAGLTLTSNLS